MPCTLCIPSLIFQNSANLFSWSTGYVFNDYLHLPYQFESEFYATVDDNIKWMARMARLSRADWEDRVAKSYLPKAVEKLIVEKMMRGAIGSRSSKTGRA